MTQLTGRLTTGQLRRVSKHGAITVTLMRRVRAGHDEFIAGWTKRTVDTLLAADGCLGAAALDTTVDNEHHMVFRFVDGVALRNWESSTTRADLLSEIEDIVLEERVTTVAGEDSYLTSLATARPPRPLLVRVAIDALWIFPVAFFWATVVAPWFATLPLTGRTFASAAVITLVAEIALFPVRRWLRSKRGLPVGHARRR